MREMWVEHFMENGRLYERVELEEVLEETTPAANAVQLSAAREPARKTETRPCQCAPADREATKRYLRTGRWS